MTEKKSPLILVSDRSYTRLAASVAELLETARRTSARAVNAIMTATYWEIGRRIVEFEQKGKRRAEYGQELLAQLSSDLTGRFGRGFSERNLEQMRLFYMLWPISQTLSAKSVREKNATPSRQLATIRQTPSAKSEMLSRKLDLPALAEAFPLSWSHYVRLLAVESKDARTFYETEALRAGWSVRQLDRQIASRFYERTLLSRNKAAMLSKGGKAKAGEGTTPEEEIKDPYILEFLGLTDEYSESEFEEALIVHLQNFLLELGDDFAFVARQKRLRIGTEWYRVDLIFFHRRLRCLVIIDLKVGKFTHADAGQIHLYLNYAREHWMRPEESPPVGLILCAEKDTAVAKYALDGLPNKVVAAEYKLALPDEKVLIAEVEQTRKMLETKRAIIKP
jgi:predicted nuclease of restriction endonuclease-like (RecB) superfamily